MQRSACFHVTISYLALAGAALSPLTSPRLRHVPRVPLAPDLALGHTPRGGQALGTVSGDASSDIPGSGTLGTTGTIGGQPGPGAGLRRTV